MSDTPAALDGLRYGRDRFDTGDVAVARHPRVVRRHLGRAQSPSFGLDWWPLRWRVPCFCTAVFDVVH